MIKKSAIYLASLGLGLASLTVPAAAQQAATAGFNAGATVKDTQGGTVGVVTNVDGDAIVVKTDRHEVRLPKTSFTPTDDGLLFGLTQAQLNAQVDQAMAAAQANFRVGATLSGSGGTAVGTVESLDDTWVTVKLNSGSSIRLPRNAIAANANGLVTSLTAAELQSAAGQAGAGAEAGTEAAAEPQ